MAKDKPARNAIVIRGARQHNLKNLDLDLPLGELLVITGVSGSGKSSLAFDTVYAEGQRRYVETFSPYARQFLDRMDRPAVDAITGTPPAIAIDQTNPVRTSRSTVGTMTELNDHLKLLFARAAHLHCRHCGQRVVSETPESIFREAIRRGEGLRAMVAFEVDIPPNLEEDEVRDLLSRQGYTRIHERRDDRLVVVQDRVRLTPERGDRIREALETALRFGRGHAAILPLNDEREPEDEWRFSSRLHCANCGIDYATPIPNSFSFNSPVGACETCHGFGRIMGIDYGLVIPDESKTLEGGAIRPFQTRKAKGCQRDLIRAAKRKRVAVDVPWRDLPQADRDWVIEGGDGWYGTSGFFAYWERKSYKMHIRVQLSRYRSYDECPDCAGARLQPESLLWRVGTKEDADAVLPADKRLRPPGADLPEETFRALPGLNVHEVMRLPLSRCDALFRHIHLPEPLDEAAELLLDGIRSRLGYLVNVGLGYLTLDRQSRTLSGGEVQRINLTTALGTSLVNTLFVLDEPSIGLHPRDLSRIVHVMHRLRDSGNSLLVVEHDPHLMRAADRILDIGPGPGERGGEVVFYGPPSKLLQATNSLTGDYLNGRRNVLPQLDNAERPEPEHWLTIQGAAEHNLKDIDVHLPLRRLTVLTGVSGSGKSSLMQSVLYNGLRKLKGQPTDPPGRFGDILGHEQIDDAVLVDQAPIGKTTRANPATYVGALDPIRKAFAAVPLARERGYKPGMFSFNTGNGRCPACGGNGFEHVEMQFLSDVYLRCPDCDGKRFRGEVLEVKLPPATGTEFRPHSIAGVLDLTVNEAVRFFSDNRKILSGLEPLQAVGLGYMQLGQPVPTLSGGESQRLKLAGHLARAPAGKNREHRLFLFDEPTTGLHFEDVAVLLRALRRLLDAGDSVLVIEHNLDVIRAADWIVDLGPEGGNGGGEVVCAGPPSDILQNQASHTAAALRGDQRIAQPEGTTLPAVAEAPTRDNAIRIRNAREHNLHNANVTIPREKLTVITGVSGSGKSTVAFDVIFNEGQRRYLESLNAYARQFVQPAARPDVDAVTGIPPTVAIEQRTSRGGQKSTVGTLTEVHHFLRLLFVKLGTQHCPDCRVPIEARSEEAIAAHILREYRNHTVQLLAPMITARKGYYTDLARWAAGKGFEHLRVDGEATPTGGWPRLDRYREHDIDLPVAEFTVTAKTEAELREGLSRTLDHGNGTLKLVDGRGSETLHSTRRACPNCGRSFPELDPRLFSYNSRHGWCETCTGNGILQSDDEAADPVICFDCHGQRLNPLALAVTYRQRNIAEYAAWPVSEAKTFFDALQPEGREAAIARDILPELRARLSFLSEVGLGYLTLDRAAPTLSGGESQRIRLAAQLGSNLQGVCYVLDEPTIGLHPRDNRMLLDTLGRLEGKGNTIVVVEHDEDTIRRAECVVDLGPGAGVNGGRVVAAGPLKDLLDNPDSITGRFLSHPLQHPLVATRRAKRAKHRLRLRGVNRHNLKNLNVTLPLERLICVTGVSGSGKSTLVRDVLHDNLHRLIRNRRKKQPSLHGCTALEGWETVDRVLEVDQTPIGKTPRSCPATYVGIWDKIRNLFARTEEARIRGYTASRFSFNTGAGRCPECGGQGMKKVEMNFLPDVTVPCEACHGQRFTPDTLAVQWQGKSIGDILKLSIDEAVELFGAQPKIHHALQLLQDVGLGYLTLGQQSPTLSGGEAQRLKLVTELARARPDTGRQRQPHTLYVLDEPTVGLHMADVENLIRVLHRLVDGGHTVIIIEHNLDIISEADWLIDMGPEGGTGGGRIVAHGTPEKVAASKNSHTGEILRAFLGRCDQAW